MKRKRSFIMLVLFVLACNRKPANVTDVDENPPPPLINYSIEKVYPHDTSSYTQGLQWVNNKLYEGTGLTNHSKVAEEDINSGKATMQQKIDTAEFGEGITVLNDTLYELTWTNNIVHVYNANTLKKIKDFSWPLEGWGLTNNGKELIISTGSSNLYFVDPHTFRLLRQVNVTDNNGPVSLLNELEYANGFVYANVYETDNIVKIDPETGIVKGRLDFSNLLTKSGMVYNKNNYPGSNGNVLNGIAYDSAKNSFYITGKMWPALFEIKLN